LNRIITITVLALLVLTGAQVLGQGTNASLSGTVLDPSKAVIPGATVTALMVETGIKTTTISNESGVYSFPSLQPGTYKITGEMPGFKTLTYDNLKLEVAGRVSLNLPLDLGTQTETVTVQATLETALGTITASVGGLITATQIASLPLPTHDVLDLTFLQAGYNGSSIFNGARIGTINTTVDGVNAVDNRINEGVYVQFMTTSDRIDEVRVVTSPADAQYSRGATQIQMSTRSGTNRYTGSMWNVVRNNGLNANSWGNNRQGIDPKTGDMVAPRSFLIQNNFGVRFGGPIIKNKTFFFAIYEGVRTHSVSTQTPTVYTDLAKQGLFRFFPGVQNANADANVPTVDLAGNPVKPATATGDLQTVNIFGRDPNRPIADPTGFMNAVWKMMPSPNYFRSGDGLNTAGYRWRRPTVQGTNNITVKIDHEFTQKHRFSGTYTFEKETGSNQFLAKPFPDSPPDDFLNRNNFLSVNLQSTFRPNLLNEARIGVFRPTFRFYAPWEVEGGTDPKYMPRTGNQPFLIVPATVTAPVPTGNDPQGRISPVYQFTDNLTWIKGSHTFMAGAELRFISSNGFNSFSAMPRAAIGAGGVPAQGITSITGIGANSGTATNLLYNLAGSIGSFYEAFNTPGGTSPNFVPGYFKYRNWKNREFATFFKDDWKVTPTLTLNLGVRWEFYSVPYDPNGRTAGAVGGSAALFSITGSGFADMWQNPPSQKGSLMTSQLIAAGSANPDLKLYNNDWNNFAPAAGLAWSIPYFGRGKTTFRAGYGWNYERVSFRLLDVVSGDNPGLINLTTITSGNYLSLANANFPLTPSGPLLSVIPINERTKSIYLFDTNLRNPYTQNWNISIQRELLKSLTLEVRYVANKGTRLVNSIYLNERDILAKGTNGETILDAFKTTQTGGSSALLNQLFNGLAISGLGTVNGTTITGSDAIRANSTTAGYLASNSVGSFASWLWTTNSYTNQVGGIPRRAGYPENWIAVNPQVASPYLATNGSGSTYNSLQVEVNKRFTSGISLQANYTLAKGMGDEEGSGQQQALTYRNLRDRQSQHRLMSFSRYHILRANGIYGLPFGPGRRLLNTSKGPLRWLVEGWTVAAILTKQSGSLMNFGSGAASWNTSSGTAMLAPGANLPKSTGEVYMVENGDIYYFKGLTQVADPYVASLTTLGSASGGVRGQASAVKAIVDASGNIILTNPLAGQLGNLGYYYLQGPGSIGLDVNLNKRVRITESKSFEMRATATSVLNHPNWGSPSTDISSTSFGRITSASGNRNIYIELRFNF